MSSENSPQKPILALPSTADETVSFDINDTYKLKELGPVGKSKCYGLHKQLPVSKEFHSYQRERHHE